MNIRTPPFPTFFTAANDAVRPAATPAPPRRLRRGETFARALQQILNASPDPCDQQLLAAIQRWRDGELA